MYSRLGDLQLKFKQKPVKLDVITLEQVLNDPPQNNIVMNQMKEISQTTGKQLFKDGGQPSPQQVSVTSSQINQLQDQTIERSSIAIKEDFLNIQQNLTKEVLMKNDLQEEVKYIAKIIQVDRHNAEIRNNLKVQPKSLIVSSSGAVDNASQPDISDKNKNESQEQPLKMIFEKLLQQSTQLDDKQIELKLQDNPIAYAYWERRKDSFRDMDKWIKGSCYFLQDHLHLMDFLLSQLDSRIKVGKSSHALMIRHFKDRVVQLETYATQFNMLEPQSMLGTLYSRNDEASTFSMYPKLTMQFFHLEVEDQKQQKALMEFKTWLDGVVRGDLDPKYKNNFKQIHEDRKLIKFLRSQIDESLQSVSRAFSTYLTAYQGIHKQIVQQKTQKEDLYVHEFKVRFQINQLIDQQREYGKQVESLYHTFTQSEEQLLHNLKSIYTQYLPKRELLLGTGVDLLSKFEAFDVEEECRSAFDLSTLFGEQNVLLLRKYCGEKPIDKVLLKGFSSMFKIDNTQENHPLILKTILLSRDVAWERSLAMTYEFIESQCKITVDGHLLFFDLEGLEALDKPSTTLHLYKLQMRQSREATSEKQMMVLSQKQKGFVFTSKAKLRVIFNDELDGEALQLLIDNYRV